MTQNLDLLIDLAVASAELENGVPAGIVQARNGIPAGALGNVHIRKNNTSWSEDEEQFLSDHLGFWSEQQIADHLGRPLGGVHLHWKRIGLPAPSKHPDYITAHKISKLLGIDAHKVVAWVDSGLLPGQRLPGLRVIRRVKRVDLLRWITNPMNWIWFDPRTVASPYYRRLLQKRTERWGDEWWTTPQVAAFHGVDVQDVKRYIKLGKLHGVQAPNRGGRDHASWSNWFILRSEATRAGVYFRKRTDSAINRTDSEEADAFLLLGRAVGLSTNVLQALMCVSNQTISNRLHRLLESGQAPDLAAKYGLEVHFRNGLIFADWRAYAWRFPSLVRAVNRFQEYLAGERPIRSQRPGQFDRILLPARGVLQVWAAWHAQDDAGRELAQRLSFTAYARTTAMLAAYKTLRGWGIDPLAAGIIYPRQ